MKKNNLILKSLIAIICIFISMPVFAATTITKIKNLNFLDEIVGSLSISGSYEDEIAEGLQISTPSISSNNAGISISSKESPHWVIYQDDTTDDLRFWNTANRVTLTDDGKVGIGITSPTQVLDVAGNINFSTNGDNTLISNYKGANSDGFNVFIGGGGQSSVGEVGWSFEGSYNTGIGYQSLQSNTTGYRNTGIGYASLFSNTTGSQNTGIGQDSLYKNTTGSNNTGLGIYSLFSNISGFNNTGIGYDSLHSNTTGFFNTGLGMYSLDSNTAGYENTGIGYNSLQSNIDGDKNTGLGTYSLYSNTTANNNTGIGYNSLYKNTTGSPNTGLGYQSLYSNTTGNYNTGIGGESLYSNTTGSGNTGIGAESLFYNTTGYANTGLGYRSLYKNTTGSSNIGIGDRSLQYNTTGSENTGIGNRSLLSNTTGNYNIGIGNQAGYYIANGTSPNQTSSNSVYLGYNTKALADGDTNEIVIGYEATGVGSNSVVLGNDSITKTVLKGNVGIGTTTPSKSLDVAGDGINLENTIFASQNGIIYKNGSRFIHNFNYGLNSGGITTVGKNTFLGEDAGNFTMGSAATEVYQASYNTGLGNSSLYSNTTGFANTGIGFASLYGNTIGNQNTALGYYSLTSNTVGTYNTSIGLQSLYSNTGGHRNTVVGKDSLFYNTTGSNNTGIGYQAGRVISDGTTYNEISFNSIYLGAYTKALADGDENEIVIGYEAIGVGSNSVVLGNDDITKTVLKGNVGIGTDSPTGIFSIKDNLHFKEDNYLVYEYVLDSEGIKGYLYPECPCSSKSRDVGSCSSSFLKYNGNIEGDICYDLYWSKGVFLWSPDVYYSNKYVLGDVIPYDVLDLNENVINTNGNAIISKNNLPIFFDSSENYSLKIGSFTAPNSNASSLTAIGSYSLYSNTSGSYNTGIGSNSLQSNTKGNYNTAIGSYSLYSNTTGYNNTGIGYNSLRYNITGYNNTGIGYQSLQANTTGSYNTGIGVFSLRSNTTGDQNTGIGYYSLNSNTTGFHNTGIGYASLFSNTIGYRNTGIGTYSLDSNTTGNHNTGIGTYSLDSNTTGSYNTGIGYNSGRYIADGSTKNETSTNSVYLGYNTKALASGDTNEIVIGYEAIGKGSNTVAIGNSSITLNYFYGAVSADSFTDRTPYPKDLKTAYDAVFSMQRLPDSEYDENNKEMQLDHSKLSDYIKIVEDDGSIARDMSATISAQNEVIKDLVKRIEELERIINE